MTDHRVMCAEMNCDWVGECPAVAECPQCGSRQLRLEAFTHAVYLSIPGPVSDEARERCEQRLREFARDLGVLA